MAGIHVKICGLSRPEDVLAARDADAIGFVVASPKSHRDVPFEKARDLARLAAPFQTIVAVTAETDEKVHAEIMERVRPDALQLPFRTPAHALKELRARFPDVRVYMAARPEDAHMMPDDLVDAYFLDSLAADRYGGTGTLTDWARARAVIADLTKPVVLAGGLRVENVVDGIRAVRPYGVDVSSGVEGADKRKDASMIRAFVSAARGVVLEDEAP